MYIESTNKYNNYDKVGRSAYWSNFSSHNICIIGLIYTYIRHPTLVDRIALYLTYYVCSDNILLSFQIQPNNFQDLSIALVLDR